MTLTETLRDEHALIDQVLGALRAYVGNLIDGGGDPHDGTRFTAFFRVFVGHFHHAREEGVFFAALVREAKLPDDHGPLRAVAQEHAQMEAWLSEMLPLLVQRPRSDDDRARLSALVTRYTHALWRHIDAENSVLYPEGAERLRLCGVYALPDRPMTEAEAAARAEGAALLRRYPPVWDATLVRGDGCFMCRAHGETCDGLEAEWWTDAEWDGFLAGDVSD